MRQLLLAALATAALTGPAMAQSASSTIQQRSWDFFLENASAAYACKLLTLPQLSSAMDEMYVIGFTDHFMPVAYAVDVPEYAQAGRKDAATPGFCQNFNPGVLNGLRQLAAGYAAL